MPMSSLRRLGSRGWSLWRTASACTASPSALPVRACPGHWPGHAPDTHASSEWRELVPSLSAAGHGIFSRGLSQGAERPSSQDQVRVTRLGPWRCGWTPCCVVAACMCKECQVFLTNLFWTKMIGLAVRGVGCLCGRVSTWTAGAGCPRVRRCSCSHCNAPSAVVHELHPFPCRSSNQLQHERTRAAPRRGRRPGKQGIGALRRARARNGRPRDLGNSRRWRVKTGKTRPVTQSSREERRPSRTCTRT